MTDLCQGCKKKPSYYGCHGIREGDVYDEYFCVECYAKRHSLSKEKKHKAIEAAEAVDAGPVPVTPPQKEENWHPRLR